MTPGYHARKGEELGYFQYGGSTHCLVFRPGAIAEFSLRAIPQPHDSQAPLMPESIQAMTLARIDFSWDRRRNSGGHTVVAENGEEGFDPFRFKLTF